MRKIRIAMITNDLNIHGISNVIMSYCRGLDPKKFKLTVIAGTPIDEYYVSEFEKHGVELIEFPSRKNDTKAYYKALFKELSGSKYDICHVHGNSAMITPELFIAFVTGVKVRIAHSHNSTCDHKIMHRILLPFFRMLHNYGFACSTLAGNWVFKKDRFYVIPNGFDVHRFRFDAQMRSDMRKKLGLKDEFIIGHVGRFNEQKNHPFILRMFELVAKENKDAYLLLIGAGPDYEKVKELIDKHSAKERIILYGETTCTEEVYNAMDMFVFPSKWEGLGIVMLEAQIAGLPCVASDAVPEDAALDSTVHFLPIKENDEKVWADIILNEKIRTDKERSVYFDEHSEEISRFDIKENSLEIARLYEEFFERS